MPTVPAAFSAEHPRSSPHASATPARWRSLLELARRQSEVTVGQWRRFVQAVGGYQTEAEKGKGCYIMENDKWEQREGRSWRNPGWTIKDSEPVVCVSHNDAQAYVRWLSQETRQDYRLPSEAQWEFAARAGSSTRFYWNKDPQYKEIHRYANAADTGSRSPTGSKWSDSADSPISQGDDKHWFVTPVKTYFPNDWKLFDMAGNVWEWTADCYERDYGKVKADGSAHRAQDASCAYRSLRGGSWFSVARYLRSAVRSSSTPMYAGSDLGFRLTRMLP